MRSVSLCQTDLYSPDQDPCIQRTPSVWRKLVDWLVPRSVPRIDAGWGMCLKSARRTVRCRKQIPVDHGRWAVSRHLSRAASRDTSHLQLSACSTAALISHSPCRKNTSVIPKPPHASSPHAGLSICLLGRLSSTPEGCLRRC
jgi:hypothetical protein